MATSSIFASFNINDKKTAEAFAAALEASSKDPRRVRTSPASIRLTDKKKVAEMFSRRKTAGNEE